MLGILETFYYNVVPFLIILSLLVFVHELGHYLAARYNKVKVEVFSIGFGPEIFGWTDRHQTRWKVSFIPLGGYVRMLSDANAASQPDAQAIEAMTEEEKKYSLFHKTVGQRMAVSGAGPLANYLFAILLLAGLYVGVGQRVPAETAKIGYVLEGSAAEKGGLKKGDEILEVNKEKIHTFVQFQDLIRQNPEKTLETLVKRNDQTLTLSLRPDAAFTQGQKAGKLGVAVGYHVVQISPLTSLWVATQDTFRITFSTLAGLGKMLIGAQSLEGLSGPIGIASLTKDAAQSSFVDLLWLMAFLSISLGLINLLPIPMLDGGHLLFQVIEAVRGRPLSEKSQEIGYRIGFMFVMGLLIFSTWNDLSRLKVFSFVKNWLG